jgi:NodT family efflux transporter outer membrane factor (OMF) lipoprotein
MPMPYLPRPLLVFTLSALSLNGCVQLGPDFTATSPTWIDQWNSPALQQASQQAPQPDSPQWWQFFNDPALNRLIAEADAHNPNLQIAGLRVLEARAALGIAESGLYPQVQQATAESLYLDRNQSNGDFPRDSNSWQYGAGFRLGWELDFWGRFSRAIEASDATYLASQANYDDVLVLLRAQVADTYFALRTAEARLRIAKENAVRQKRSYEITERLFNSGNNAELDLQQAKTQYLGTLSTVPEFETQVLRTRNALSVLIGQPPSSLPQLAENQGLIPLVEVAVLDDVPANLLLRRPDVRAAELQAAAQSARIGVAESEFYPAISLLGSISWSASSLNGVSDNRDLAAGPSLTWNIFDYGRIGNNVRVQDARFQQLLEAYRDRVLQAAREADDAATGLIKALERERILGMAADSANRSLELASAQYREGYSDFQRVLDAQRALFQQQDSYLVSRSNAVSSLIALYKSLGGGWQSRLPLIDPATREQMQERTDWGNLLDDQHQSTTETQKARPHD